MHHTQTMFSAKQLSHDQIDLIKQWADQGAQLADIQKRMREELAISLTYMETRLIILDLGITLIEETPEPEAAYLPGKSIPTGKTTVSLDPVPLPGAIISGSVTFSDGERAAWMLDQMGRPSLNPESMGYQPSQQDIMDFQQQLRSILEQQGF